MEKLRIIALLGKSRAGKDHSGKILCEMGSCIRFAFANKLKEICREMFQLSDDDVFTEEGKNRQTALPMNRCPECKSLEVELITRDHDILGSCKLCGATGDVGVFKSAWTPRMILQFVGTECFRRIDPGVWVNFALRTAREHLTENPKTAALIITDCRFKSEVAAVLSVGGEVWRIRRPKTDGKSVGIAGHASETEQDSIADTDVTEVIVNDGTIENLQAKLALAYGRFQERHK